MSIRRAGVIAAGHGERLRDGGYRLKPLVPVAGLTLVEHVLTSLAETRPAEVVVIVNEASTAVRDHVSARDWPFALRWIVETTPSSMHSFLRVLETLAAGGPGGDDGPFLVSTVDTIAAPGAFAQFAHASSALDADIVLAVSHPTDDDNPLGVKVAPGASAASLVVVAIGAAAAGAEWATTGYYSVRASVLGEADAARKEGVTALRHFLERLLARGYKVAAVPVASGIDVDRPGDVRAAEQFLRQAGM